MCSISVVVPVYNCEKTLEKCLDSILNQGFSDIELIIINDGTPDDSDAICQKYLKKNNTIKYIVQENKGLAAVRNRGIKEASGEFICFVDSDDYIDAGCLEFMHKKAISTGADIVLCGYIMENSGSRANIFAKDTLLNGTNINEGLIELKTKNLIDPAWNKLYRLDFLRKTGVLMPEGELYEDTSFNLQLLAFKPVIAVCSKCFYHYVLHMGSITRRYNTDKLDTLKKRARFLKQNTNGIEKFCDFYFLKCVFSSFIDMFFSLSRREIYKIISKEINKEEFRLASRNAQYKGKSALLIINVAKSGNTLFVYLFCRLSFILKYKMQRLFLKVRNV